jgi:hypothetical protein
MRHCNLLWRGPAPIDRERVRREPAGPDAVAGSPGGRRSMLTGHAREVLQDGGRTQAGPSNWALLSGR